MLVAAYMEKHPGSPQTIKQHLAAIKMLFDYLLISQIVPTNPAAPLLGPPATASRCNFRLAMNYNPSTQTLLLYWSLGSILVTGPKAEAFFERFSEHRVALVMVDGKDILRVVISLRQGKAKSELGCPCPLDFSVQRENRENWKNRMRCTLMTCNARPSVLEGGR